jgi:hypothetical protein
MGGAKRSACRRTPLPYTAILLLSIDKSITRDPQLFTHGPTIFYPRLFTHDILPTTVSYPFIFVHKPTNVI